MICVYCHLPIDGPSIGAGDGTGQKFAHPYCYYRKRCEELEVDNVKLRTELGIYKEVLGEKYNTKKRSE